MIDSNDCSSSTSLEATEQGQEVASHEAETTTNPAQHKPTRLAAYFAMATFALVAVTSTASQQPFAQEHRRLSSSPFSSPYYHRHDGRRLGVTTAIRQVFTFIIGVGEQDDEHVHFNNNEGTLMTGGEDSVNDNDNDGQCPGRIAYKGLYMEVPSIYAYDLGGEFGIDISKTNTVTNKKGGKGGYHQRTFEVQPNHTVLQDDDGVTNGVMFNVETVPDPLPHDAYKPRLSQREILGAVEMEASRFYGIEKVVQSKQIPTARDGMEVLDFSDSIIEVMSRTPTNDKKGGGTVFASSHGFLAACMTAFAHHLPLALTPDDMWTVIANGFARHVNANAEELRSNFVDHEGKKEIRIREDSMVKNRSPPEQWEAKIFPKFAEAIANNTNNPEVIDTLVIRNFTTSTVASQAASEILLMSTMKNYFKYQMDTMCGIPNVRLEGTRADWESLRERTKTLAQWMLQDDTHGDLWIYDIVLPILDQFLLSYDGDVDYCFWQNMVKFRTSGAGSGSYDFLSGWLPTLFPYLSARGGVDRPNPYLRHWLESASAQHLGPKPNEIPAQISTVPVLWNYYGTEFPLHFHAGFRGVHQEEDGTIRPTIGWYVTEDPNQ